MDLMIVDLHCHTYRSEDCLMRPDKIREVGRRKGIDRIAITDHNVVSGAFEAAQLDGETFIVGEEIRTTEGELLAYFVQEFVPPGLSPEETIARLRDQGSVISIAHPFDSFRSGSWNGPALERILSLVDAVEVFNARNWSASANREAIQLAESHHLPGTAGSDAHAYFEIGRGALRLPSFDGPEGFRRALREAELLAKPSSPWVHLFSRYASFRKKLGWRP
jgi:predicted metal-dependent phosphoesterase TrpH